MMRLDQGGEEAMRTTCPDCDTAYTVPDDRIGPKGRKVRCTRCGAEWRAMLAAPAPALDPFEAVDVAPDGADPFEDLAASATPTADAPRDVFDADLAAAEVDAAFDAPPPEASRPEASQPEPAPTPAAPVAPAKTPPAFARAKRRRSFALHLPAVSPRQQAFGGVAIFLAALAFCTGLVVFRTEVVTRVPALAGLYRLVGLPVNLRGVVFGQIETLRETEDGKPVLVVEGHLLNTTGTAHDVPALRFALRDSDGQELYAWSIDPRATTVAAGDRLRFRTRLVAPPERAADLQVRFTERRNRQAGLP